MEGIERVGRPATRRVTPHAPLHGGHAKLRARRRVLAG